MSDALAYLVKARPDAVGHYFQFLKECGKHLDPKTRDLISVITKVHAQTERGFKQYLNRALRDGCTPMEVLDALLMAFPALGLAKIVWAVDIILAMELESGSDLAREFNNLSAARFEIFPGGRDLKNARQLAIDSLEYSSANSTKPSSRFSPEVVG